MDIFIPYAIVFWLGAAVGSFLNVVIYRLPAGLSLLYPPSRCPRCETRLKAYDNVPVLGWLWLRGRCRYCSAGISPRYPLVELGTGFLFLSIFSQFGLGWQALGYWLFASWLVALALIDIDTLTLPNSLTFSGLFLGCLYQGWLSYVTSPAGQDAIQQAAHGMVQTLIVGVAGLWLFESIAALGSLSLGKTAMGGGDAKLAAMLGVWLGWQGILLSLMIGTLLGTLIGGSALALNRLKRHQAMPFGPFLALGALLALFYGQGLVEGYLSLFF